MHLMPKLFPLATEVNFITNQNGKKNQTCAVACKMKVRAGTSLEALAIRPLRLM
jgi:hypothetical protein